MEVNYPQDNVGDKVVKFIGVASFIIIEVSQINNVKDLIIGKIKWVGQTCSMWD